MDASGAGASTPPTAPSVPHASASVGGVAVVDSEGRPRRGLGSRGAPAAAKVCYGMLFYTRDDADAQRPPVRALTQSLTIEGSAHTPRFGGSLSSCAARSAAGG
jgi:hypothetical protein